MATIPKEVSKYLASIGRKGGLKGGKVGGASKSVAKRLAAQKNGKKGGRPKESTRKPKGKRIA